MSATGYGEPVAVRRLGFGRATSLRRGGGWSSQRRSILLIAPLLCATVVLFLYPVASMLYTAVDNSELAATFPQTRSVLADWDGEAPTPDAVFQAIHEDIARAGEGGSIAGTATKLNYSKAGFRSLLMKTSSAIRDGEVAPTAAAFAELDRRWADPDFLTVLKRETATFTSDNVLAVLDLQRTHDGGIERVEESRRLYISYLTRTLWISGCVTALCLLIAYPMAYVMAQSEGRKLKILLALVLVPFWISLLVRAAAWVVLLQKQGVVNDLLVWIGIADAPIQLIFNRIGVLVGMTYTLIPFAVLPLFASMRAIPSSQMRAALSLGARPASAFATVYLPQTIPGAAAGALLCFVLANGFYITPALLGGANDQLLSSLIADFAIGRANWGMASALAILLLLSVGVVLILFGRFARREGTA